jgi:hypothetical protein
MEVDGQNHAPAAFTPGKTRYPLYRRLGGPQGRSGRVRKISLPPGFDPRTFQPLASRYTDYAIPAQIRAEARYFFSKASRKAVGPLASYRMGTAREIPPTWSWPLPSTVESKMGGATRIRSRSPQYPFMVWRLITHMNFTFTLILFPKALFQSGNVDLSCIWKCI